MKECRYCKKPMKEEDTVCAFCGYDHKTNTINQSFEPVKKKERKTKTHRGIDPRVKYFAYLGLALTLFSILYAYNFNINAMMFEIKENLPIIKIGKLDFGKSDKKKNREIEKIELTDVRSFSGERKTFGHKNLKIEGIFFDPGSKSFVSINGKVMAEGEAFENVTIQKINRDSVEIVIDGQIRVLEVDQSFPLPVKD